MSRGKSSWNEDALVPIFRNGRIEEVYWTYGYSPVCDDHNRIVGTLVVCTETTARVVPSSDGCGASAGWPKPARRATASMRSSIKR